MTKRILLLSCKDLTGHICDDDLLVGELTQDNHIVDVLPWDQEIQFSNYDIAIIRTTWDYHHKPQAFLSTLKKIEDAHVTLYSPYQLVLWNYNKTYLEDLAQRGVKILPTHFVKESTDQVSINNFIKSHPSEKYILKPSVGANASGIKVYSISELEQINKCIFETCDVWLLQPFFDEILSGEKSFHFFNRKFSHAILKVPKSGDFRVQEEHGGLISSIQPTQSDLQAAQKVIDKIEGPLLYARVDMISIQGELYLMEIELIEPSLYFRMNSQSARNFADALNTIISNS